MAFYLFRIHFSVNLLLRHLRQMSYTFSVLGQLEIAAEQIPLKPPPQPVTDSWQEKRGIKRKKGS